MKESNNTADLTVGLMAFALGALQGTLEMQLFLRELEEGVQRPKPEQLKRTAKNFSWESPSGVTTLLATETHRFVRIGKTIMKGCLNFNLISATGR